MATDNQSRRKYSSTASAPLAMFFRQRPSAIRSRADSANSIRITKTRHPTSVGALYVYDLI